MDKLICTKANTSCEHYDNGHCNKVMGCDYGDRLNTTCNLSHMRFSLVLFRYLAKILSNQTQIMDNQKQILSLLQKEKQK